LVAQRRKPSQTNKQTDNKQTLLCTWRERGMGFSADGDSSPSSAKAKCTEEPGGGFVSGESRKEESRTVDPPPPRRYSLRDT